MTTMFPMLKDEEKRDITLICFAEVIVAAVANRQKPKTRRHNQLSAAIEKLKKADQTYHGFLPESYQAEAEAVLENIENQLMALYAEEK